MRRQAGINCQTLLKRLTGSGLSYKGLITNLRIKLVYLLILLVTAVYSQDKKTYYYYRPEADCGTELVFNPGIVILNGTFDILRNGAHSKNILEQKYFKGMKNVWWNITHPIENVKQYGWKNFIGQEVIPLSMDKEKARYLPNYMHHVFGSGMIYKKMAEWYDYHGIKLMPTYHPAYLLRNPGGKKDVWDDMKMVAKELGLEIPTRK